MKNGTDKKRRGLSGLLALTMAVGLLAGCGQKNTDGEGGNKQDGSDAPASADFVYVASYIPIQGEFSGMLRNPVYANGSIYCTTEERHWVEADPGDLPVIVDEPEEGEVILFEAETAEEPAPTAEGDIWIEEPVEEPGFYGEEGEYNGYWDYGTAIYKINLDGSSKKIPFTAEEAVNGENMSSSAYLSSISISGSGEIYTLEEVYRSWTDAPDGVTWETDPEFYEKYYHYENSFVMKRLDEDGNILGTVDLAALNPNPDDPNSYFYLNDFKVDRDGNIYAAGDYLYILDKDGKVLQTIEAMDDNISNLMIGPDGDVYAMVYSWSGDSSSSRMVKLDPDTAELGEGTKLPSMYNMVPGGGDYPFYYTNGINFFGYDPETGESAKLLNWISCDVNPSYAGNAIVLEDGRVVAVDSHYDYSTPGFRSYAVAVDYDGFASEEQVVNELIILTKTPADQVPQKEILTLATQYLDYNMRSGIIDFNRSSDKYRIEVLDYSEYNTDDDWNAGLTKLKTEISSGKLPDILDLSQLPISQMAAKGMLEDLYTWIDSDPDLSREDFLPNVLAASENDGKLYRTVTTFNVQAFMGPAALVGDTPGWTVEQFKAALRQLQSQEPRATALNQYMTRSDILMYLLRLDMDNFVNWSTGQCSFDSEGFIGLLEFANSFPSEFDWENYEWTDEDDEYYRLGHGLQMLAQLYLSDFQAYELRIYNKIMGGQGVFVGLPTSYGVGNFLSFNGGSYAMSSKCANKEGAWQFLRQFFTESSSLNINAYGFPVNRNSLQRKLADAMKIEYQTDENGNYLLDENGGKIPVDYGTWGWGEFEVPGGPLTQEEAEQIMTLLESTTKVMDWGDDELSSIIEEGIAPYFDGERSAEEVAKQLQSKITLYVNERR